MPRFPARNGCPATPGIMALTASLQVVYFNREAQEISRLLVGGREPLQSGAVPVEVLKICEETLARMNRPREVEHPEHSHLRRLAGVGHAVHLRAFSIPGASADGAPLIIVLMEQMAMEAVAEIRDAQARFKLTDRELHVAEHLARGLTNREIALTLCITEQTVKQHVKHMMLKTQATTRTGVLAQLLGASRQNTPTRSSSSLRSLS
jgi:DNA-binding CsgD family transcriptional regulator